MKNKKKFFIFITILLVYFAIFCFCGRQMYIKEQNFDKSKIKQVNGTVSEITAKDNDLFLSVELENGSTKSIYAGKEYKNNLKETVSIYTDGKYYELTEERVVYKAANIRLYAIIQVILIYTFLLLICPFSIFYVLNVICNYIHTKKIDKLKKI